MELDGGQFKGTNSCSQWFLSHLALACENSRPSSLPAQVAFREKDVCDLPPKIPY